MAFVIEMALICCRSVARKVPMNYILLLAFTLCEAFAFSFICSFYSVETTLYAATTTAALTVALTLYACTTKTDFTMMGGLMISICVAIFMLMIMSMFMSWVSWWTPMVSALLVVFYGLFLVYDTQLVAGGGSYSLGLDEYIVGALIIYVDIMAIFLELLKLFGDR